MNSSPPYPMVPRSAWQKCSINRLGCLVRASNGRTGLAPDHQLEASIHEHCWFGLPAVTSVTSLSSPPYLTDPIQHTRFLERFNRCPTRPASLGGPSVSMTLCVSALARQIQDADLRWLTGEGFSNCNVPTSPLGSLLKYRFWMEPAFLTSFRVTSVMLGEDHTLGSTKSENGLVSNFGTRREKPSITAAAWQGIAVRTQTDKVPKGFCKLWCVRKMLTIATLYDVNHILTLDSERAGFPPCRHLIRAV